jgi:hypothetical protein
LNLQEFQRTAIRKLPDAPTREEWAEAVAFAESKLTEVDESDRPMASSVIGATLIQWGAFWGFLEQQEIETDDDIGF